MESGFSRMESANSVKKKLLSMICATPGSFGKVISQDIKHQTTDWQFLFSLSLRPECGLYPVRHDSGLKDNFCPAIIPVVKVLIAFGGVSQRETMRDDLCRIGSALMDKPCELAVVGFYVTLAGLH